MEQLNWSNWCNLVSLDLSLVPKTSGLYQLRWAIDGKPQPINRVDGVDVSGCLYVGKTTAKQGLKTRIKKLRRGLIQLKNNAMSYTHTAIYTYSLYGFHKKFKLEQIEVRWAELLKEGKSLEEHKYEVDYWEEKLLGDYVEKYLDKPPLSISIRRL